MKSLHQELLSFQMNHDCLASKEEVQSWKNLITLHTRLKRTSISHFKNLLNSQLFELQKVEERTSLQTQSTIQIKLKFPESEVDLFIHEMNSSED